MKAQPVQLLARMCSGLHAGRRLDWARFDQAASGPRPVDKCLLAVVVRATAPNHDGHSNLDAAFCEVVLRLPAPPRSWPGESRQSRGRVCAACVGGMARMARRPHIRDKLFPSVCDQRISKSVRKRVVNRVRVPSCCLQGLSPSAARECCSSPAAHRRPPAAAAWSGQPRPRCHVFFSQRPPRI